MLKMSERIKRLRKPTQRDMETEIISQRVQQAHLHQLHSQRIRMRDLSQKLPT